MSTQKGASIMNSIVMEAFRAKAAVGNDQWKGVGAILRKAIDERPGAPAGEELRQADPLVPRAAFLEALEAQADDAAVVGRVVGPCFDEAPGEHQNASPFSMR